MHREVADDRRHLLPLLGSRMSKVEEKGIRRLFNPVTAIDLEETAGEVFVDGLSVPGSETEAILAPEM